MAKKMSRARRACWLTDCPHDGPTKVLDTLSLPTWNSWPRALLTAWVGASASFSVCTRIELSPILVTVTLPACSPALDAASCTVSWARFSKPEMLRMSETRNSEPPRNSRPRLRPLNASEPMQTASSRPDSRNHTLRRPT